MAFDKKVEICDEPLKKICNDTIVGEEVCRTEYETRYKNHTVEQDEPICKMVMEKKCEGTGNNQAQVITTRRRSIARIENREQFTRQPDNCKNGQFRSVHKRKKTVTKSTPETSCQKYPREV